VKNRIINLCLVLALFIGIGLIVYPSFSDYWNSFHQSRVIAHYAEDIESIDNEKYAVYFDEANQWNERLAAAEIGDKMILTEEEIEEYNGVLDPLGSGMIGYIEIPSISCFLGIYHGTSNAVLQVATGHLEWSSLPVGGESTHAVISGHRGLPSAKLFTELDKLKIGDIFEIYILNETFTYSVDQINIVEPNDVSMLGIFPEEDYVTLVTCTPYGINTHRLLIRGTRVENIVDNTLHFTSEAMQIDTVIVATVLSIPILLLLVIYVFVSSGRNDAKIREKIKNEALQKIMNHQSPVSAEAAETAASAEDAKKTTRRKKPKKPSVVDMDTFLDE
jgi:sortase A